MGNSYSPYYILSISILPKYILYRNNLPTLPLLPYFVGLRYLLENLFPYLKSFMNAPSFSMMKAGGLSLYCALVRRRVVIFPSVSWISADTGSRVAVATRRTNLDIGSPLPSPSSAEGLLGVNVIRVLSPTTFSVYWHMGKICWTNQKQQYSLYNQYVNVCFQSACCR